MVVAVKISRQHSKDEILGDYLNAIYFGRGAYGIQAAAHAYFGRPVTDLTAAEGALLAGLIQSPSRWDPAIDPDKAVQRWNFVLDGMVAQGWLPRAERDALVFPATVPRRPSTGGVPADARGHVVTAVRAELEDLGITEQELSQAGLRITTTVDPMRQRAAVEAAHAGLAGQPVNLRSAMVAVDPATGGVLAYYGGDNGTGLDYARVRRLAGSTFKPFVVLAGLRETPPVGLGETFDGAARPGLRNAEGAECARCDLKQAMTVSNNVVFHTVARRLGPEKVADAARAAGITAPLDDPDEGIALGNKEVSTLELASAYATIAGGGVWHPPHLVSQVVTADGRVLYRASPEGERRFPEQVARNVTEAMLAVADRDGLGLGRRPVAAKTGTVQSRFPGENNDAWMAGFTPQLAASVWMGTDRNSPIRTASGEPISGRTLPGEVWRGFMAEALSDAPAESFPPFRPLGTPPSDAPPNATATPVPTAPPTAPPTALPPDPEIVDGVTDPDGPAADPLDDAEDGEPADEGRRLPRRRRRARGSAGRSAPVGERPGGGTPRHGPATGPRDGGRPERRERRERPGSRLTPCARVGTNWPANVTFGVAERRPGRDRRALRPSERLQQRAGDDEVRAVAGGLDQCGVRLVHRRDPRHRLVRRLAERDVAGVQPGQAHVVAQRAEPHLVQQRTHRGPAARLQQQVVALGHHEPRRRQHRDRARERLLEGPLERRGVHHPVLPRSPIPRTQPGQQRRVTPRVEGVGGALRVPQPQPLQLDVRQVIAVHRHVRDPVGAGPGRRVGAQRGQQGLGQRRLARPRAADDPEHRAPSGGDEAAGPRDEVVERGHADTRSARTTMSSPVSAPVPRTRWSHRSDNGSSVPRRTRSSRNADAVSSGSLRRSTSPSV